MELYVLRIDNYKEWAWENGACNLIGVYDNIDSVINELLKCLSDEVNYNEYIIGEHKSLEDIKKDLDNYKTMNIGNSYYIDIFTTEYDYDNGNNMGTYVIEKKILNDSGVFM